MVDWKVERRTFLTGFLCFIWLGGVLSSVAILPATAEQLVQISQVANWKHPVKDVLSSFGIEVTRVELARNKTYPLIYCVFPEYSPLREKECFVPTALSPWLGF